MEELVTYERNEQGFGVIQLNRPNKRHAISLHMVNLLKGHLQTAKRDQIKFLVLTATSDEAFCAGGDLNELHAELTRDEAFSLLYPMKEVLYELVSFPIPTICLLNGNSFGGGCELATACDFRYAKEHTVHGFIQTKLGILPSWGGGTILYEKVAPVFAYHWLITGNNLDSDTLQQNGWLQKVILSDEWGNLSEMLRSFIDKSDGQLKMLKEQYLKKMPILSLSAEMSMEVRNAVKLWDSPEHKAAVQAFIK